MTRLCNINHIKKGVYYSNLKGKEKKNRRKEGELN